MKKIYTTEINGKYKNYPESDLTNKIIKSAINVHKTLGCGFLEKIYENALKEELKQNKIQYEQQKIFSIFYKGQKVGEHIIDLVIENKVIVEIKAVKFLEDIHRSQIISYLKATEIKIGLVLNFGKPQLEIERFIV